MEFENVEASGSAPSLEGSVAGDSMVTDGIETSTGVVASTAGSTQDRLKRKAKRIVRQNSRENVASGTVLPQRSWKNNRRSRNGHGRGLPKKGGAGGKGVWGLPGSELLEEYEDMNDPNFDTESINNKDVELKAVIPKVSVEEFLKKAEPVILEYFEHGDTQEAAQSFEEFIFGPRNYLITQLAIELAMDHKPSHREMTSVLISDLYGVIISEKDIAYAFEELLKNLPDLILDTPEAPTLLGNFIARAVADDCLPPKFIMTHKENPANEHSSTALARADTLLSMKHGMVRLDNVWGVGGGLRPVKSLTRQMNLLLKEFLSSGDIQEAIRCLQALEVPHFHHELVYEAVVIAIEAVNSNIEAQICTFLKALDQAVIITPHMMERGFQRVFDDMADICLDVPLAYIMLDRFVERCHNAGFISENVMKKMPNRGRKRFVSEGDGGHIKEHSFVRE